MQEVLQARPASSSSKSCFYNEEREREIYISSKVTAVVFNQGPKIRHTKKREKMRLKSVTFITLFSTY